MSNFHSVLLLLGTSLALSSAAPGITVSAPVFTPGNGSDATDFLVGVSCSTPGALIHYTLNGIDPDQYDPLVSSGIHSDATSIPVSRHLVIKAKAWVGTDSSPVTTGTFSVTGDLSAGGQHSLALSSKSISYSWGNQFNGRLGNGIATNTDNGNPATPQRATDSDPEQIVDARSVAAGGTHSVIVDQTGHAWCFGTGTYGEMGNNDNSAQSYAVEVLKSPDGTTAPAATDFLTNGVMAAAGVNFSGALGADGKVYTWGYQLNGRLGNGVTSSWRGYAAPVKKSATINDDLTGIAQIEFGDTQGLARATDGTVWAWGLNSTGQLGIGNLTQQTYAVQVKLNATTSLTDVTDISSGDTHSAVVRWKDGDSNLQGSVWTFGGRGNGRIGDNGAIIGNVTYPVQVKKTTGAFLSNVIQVSAGSAHTLALDATGHVWAWGYNGYGALGDGTTTNRAGAVAVLNPAGTAPLDNIVFISAGGTGTTNFSLAIAADGTVYSWGINNNAQLGRGAATTGASSLPVAIPAPFQLIPRPPDITVTPVVLSGLEFGDVKLVPTISDPDGLGDIDHVDYWIRTGIYQGGEYPSVYIFGAPWIWENPHLYAQEIHGYARVVDKEGNMGYSNPFTFTILPDSDHDGLSDAWEMQYFGNYSQTPDGDPDGDGLTNLQEQALGTNPNSAADSDGDGLPDDWEMYWFHNLTHTGTADDDGDGLTNHDEFLLRLNPTNRDTNGDGIPDGYSNYYFPASVFSSVPYLTAPFADYDGDGVNNITESDQGRIPISAGEIIPIVNFAVAPGMDLRPAWWGSYAVKYTIEYSTDNGAHWTLSPGSWTGTNAPLHPQPHDIVSSLPVSPVASLSGYTFRLISNAQAIDTDSDGLWDAWEFKYFGSITAQNGAGNPDNDALNNSQEQDVGSNPTIDETNFTSGDPGIFFKYDIVGRLLSSTSSAGFDPYGFLYAYDAEGNITIVGYNYYP